MPRHEVIFYENFTDSWHKQRKDVVSYPYATGQRKVSRFVLEEPKTNNFLTVYLNADVSDVS